MEAQIQQQIFQVNGEISAVRDLLAKVETKQTVLLRLLVRRTGGIKEPGSQMSQVNGHSQEQYGKAGEDYIDLLIGG